MTDDCMTDDCSRKLRRRTKKVVSDVKEKRRDDVGYLGTLFALCGNREIDHLGMIFSVI